VSTSSTPSQVYSNTHTGVVKITTESGLGTGIVLDSRGDILTNDHVVEGANRFNVSFDSSNQTHSAKLVGTDPSDDLAVIKLTDTSGLNLTPLTLGDSNTVQVGDTVYALGNPFGYTNSFSEGIVSGLDRSMTAPNGFTIGHSIQTDAAINPGNSGGPLLNGNGEVVGINAQIASNGSPDTGQGQNNGVGFAIPINTARKIADELIKTGQVERGFLGIGVAPITPRVSSVLRLPVDHGLIIQSVEPGSAAAKAGLRVGSQRVVIAGNTVMLGGDILTAVDGKSVTTYEELSNAISSKKPGDEVTLTIYRNGKQLTVTAKLGRQPAPAPPRR
jgi:putative serine protease PepD